MSRGTEERGRVAISEMVADASGIANRSLYGLVAYLPNTLGGGADSAPSRIWDSRGQMTSSTFGNAEDHDSAEVERVYLIVSSDSPVEVRAAMLRAPSAPDLCVRSPSPDAQRAAEAAFGGGYVRTIVEPLLARRGDGESLGDFMSRCADALRTLYAFDTRTALVVFDELPAALGGALELQERDLLRIADELERTAPAA